MRILIAGRASEVCAQIEAVLRNAGATDIVRVDLKQLFDALSRSQPQAILLTVGHDHAQELQLIRELVPILLTTQLAVVGPATDPKFILQTMKLGASRYIDQADLNGELVQLIEEIGRASLSPAAVRSVGRVIAVLGLTGGAGATTISLNCAVETARLQNGAGLLDLDLSKGDLAPMLNAAPVHTIVDFCRNLSRMDDIMFRQCFVTHSSGVQLMAAPTRLRESAEVTPAALQRLISLARLRFATVWVDLRQYYLPEFIPVLKAAEQLVCVMRQDFTSLHHAARLMGYLDDLEISPDTVGFVVGRCGQSKNVGLKEMESALKVTLLSTIPDDAASANEATNKGQPVVLTRPRSAVAKSIRALAEKLTLTAPAPGLLKW